MGLSAERNPSSRRSAARHRSAASPWYPGAEDPEKTRTVSEQDRAPDIRTAAAALPEDAEAAVSVVSALRTRRPPLPPTLSTAPASVPPTAEALLTRILRRTWRRWSEPSQPRWTPSSNSGSPERNPTSDTVDRAIRPTRFHSRGVWWCYRWR